MAYAFVQEVSNITGAPQAITPTALNALVGYVITNNTGATSVTVADTAGNIWAKSVTPILTADSAANIFYFYSFGVAGTATTVTVTPNASAINQYYVAEFSSLGSFLNASSNIQSNPGTGTNAVTSAVANATAQPAAVIGMSINANGRAAALSAGTGFTARTSVWATASYTGYPEDIRVTATGNVAATWTASSGAQFDGFTSLVLLFAESGSQPPGTAPLAWIT
jgi:hypothetical protein